MTPPADYRALMAIVRDAVKVNGKQLVAWEEFARADASPDDVVQHWVDPALASGASARGAKIVLSPSKRAYLDMQYELDVPMGVGTFWAGFINVSTAYDWDPGAWLPEVPESSVLGVEAPVWTETIATTQQLDAMTFPRLLGFAELGWSRGASAGVRDYLVRLGTHGPRLEAWGIAYFRSPQVPWAE
jgi:hexosaminidase